MTARFRTLVVAVALQAACMAQAALGAHPKLARDLDSIFAGDFVTVIVQYKPEGFKRLNGAVRARYANVRELTAKGSLPSLNSEVMSVRARDLTVIADDVDVEFVWPDRIVRSSSFSGSPDYAWITTGAKAANTNFALDGAGIGVAILDSGVAEHPDLNSKVRYAANFVPAETDTRDGYG